MKTTRAYMNIRTIKQQFSNFLPPLVPPAVFPFMKIKNFFHFLIEGGRGIYLFFDWR